jgi:uncharacterized surface protein with fasciclin (FAS1) repeats
MNKNKGVWVGFVALAVIAALGLWWIAARQPLDMNLGLWGTRGEEQLPTDNTNTGTTTGNGGKTATVSTVNKNNSDVNAVVASLSTASQFNALYRSTGVAGSISKTGKYTIFVPTNGAIAQLAPGTISNLSAAEKKRLVQYHVVSGRSIDVDATVAGTIQALSGDMLNFSYGTQKLPMVNSSIVITQYVTKNGTVYLIDNVLLPPKKTN